MYKLAEPLFAEAAILAEERKKETEEKAKIAQTEAEVVVKELNLGGSDGTVVQNTNTLSMSGGRKFSSNNYADDVKKEPLGNAR